MCVCVLCLSLSIYIYIYIEYRLDFCTKLQPEAPLGSDERRWEIQVMYESICLMKQQEERQMLAAIEASNRKLMDFSKNSSDDGDRHENKVANVDNVRSTIREEERLLLVALDDDDDEGREKRNDLLEIQVVNDSLRTMMREEEQQLIAALQASRLESMGWCNGRDVFLPDTKSSSSIDKVNFATKIDHDGEKAAISIQTLFRVVIAKNKVRDMRPRRTGKSLKKTYGKAARRIQACVRGFIQRQKDKQAAARLSIAPHVDKTMKMMCHDDDSIIMMSHHHHHHHVVDKMMMMMMSQTSNNEPENDGSGGSSSTRHSSSSSSVVTVCNDKTSDDEVILDDDDDDDDDDCAAATTRDDDDDDDGWEYLEKEENEEGRLPYYCEDDGESDSDSSLIIDDNDDDDDFVHVTSSI